MPRVSALSELTFEVPIDEQSETSFLTKALKHVQILHVLEFRSEGFLLLCRGSREESARFKEALSIDESHNFQVRILNRTKSGDEMILVSGKLLIGRQNGKLSHNQTKELKFFKTMEKAQIYSLGNPIFQEGKIRVSLIADEKMIGQLLNGLEKIKIPYKLLRLGPLKTKRDSPLNSLTVKQTRILRLAHSMGYYEVPKKTRTEDIARLLQMEKGTVGEHLRRAEKHVFDRLLLD